MEFSLTKSFVLEISYSTAIQWQGSKIYFNSENLAIIHPRDYHEQICKRNIRGGVLADDIGLGKTFEGKTSVPQRISILTFLTSARPYFGGAAQRESK